MRFTPLGSTGLLVLILALPQYEAAGQMFTYERPRAPTMTTLGPALHVVDFNTSGNDTLLAHTPFSGPAYGIHFTRPGFAAYLAYGTATNFVNDVARDIRLIDASLTLWSGMDLLQHRRVRLILPITLHSGYRGIDERGTGPLGSRSFDLTVFGIGSGLAAEMRPGERIAFEARALPMAGLAIRSFEGAAGTTLLADIDAQMHLLNLVDDFGLSIGYSFRAQRWNVDTALPGAAERRDTFTGVQHTVKVAVNW